MENNNSMIIDLSVLSLIPKILEELNELKKFKESFDSKLNLTSQTDVLKFLGLKSRTTLKKYVDENVFEEGVHYTKENNRIIYIPSGIVEFRNSHVKNRKALHGKIEEQEYLEKVFERFAS